MEKDNFLNCCKSVFQFIGDLPSIDTSKMIFDFRGGHKDYTVPHTVIDLFEGIRTETKTEFEPSDMSLKVLLNNNH